jgi:group II intron reverse transcriptase/maturase
METGLGRIADIAKARLRERFTSLAHLINVDSLKACHQGMDGKKAAGVDKVTQEEYEANLEDNLTDLVARMKRQAYKPQPVRRVYIPKPGTNKQRPLGIPAYEDKLVQAALSEILNAIYEADFLDCSYGFRPGRGCHDAIGALAGIIEREPVNYIVDADIEGFFDHVDHEWLMKFLEVRIADPNLLRIVARFLKAGMMEAGVKYDTPEGTPQGGVASPILANVYLHYALDLWFHQVARKSCKGKAFMVRYADDFVCCFQFEEDARAFYQALVQRLAKFNLEVADEKTRIIAFGRKAEETKREQGGGKSDTFDFVGFTHYCSKGRKGQFRVKRKTSRKKLRASLLRCKVWLQRNRSLPAVILMNLMRVKMLGHYRFYGVTDNFPTLSLFHRKTQELLYKWLNRRSQRKSFNLDKFKLFLGKFPLPKPKIYVNIYKLRPGLAGCSR